MHSAAVLELSNTVQQTESHSRTITCQKLTAYWIRDCRKPSWTLRHLVITCRIKYIETQRKAHADTGIGITYDASNSRQACLPSLFGMPLHPATHVHYLPLAASCCHDLQLCVQATRRRDRQRGYRQRENSQVQYWRPVPFGRPKTGCTVVRHAAWHAICQSNALQQRKPAAVAAELLPVVCNAGGELHR